MDDLLREFLTETNESLDVVDVELVRFEQDPNNASLYLKRGELHRIHQDWPAAAADYDRAAQLDPNLAVVDLARGAMAAVELQHIEAARNLGARRLRVLVDIVLPQVRGTLLVGLVLSFVTMLSVLSVPLMINPNSPTMVTVDVAYRISTHGDYPVANALCLLSLALAAIGAVFYLRHAAAQVEGK